MRAVKTTFLLTALTLLLLFGGQHLGGQRGMTLGLVIAVIMNGGAYFFSDKIALKSAGAQPVSEGTGAAALCRDGTTGGQGWVADAEAVPDTAASAERVRDGKEPEPCFGGRH